MANPKHKLSRSRTRKRRAHDHIEVPNLSVCPNCKEAKMPHKVCIHCGFYNGEQVVREKKEKKAAG